MKVHFFFLAFALLLADISFAQTSTIEAAEVIDNGLRWDQTTFDFGEIAQNKPQTASFVVTNSGDTPFVITDVNSSCGCTVAEHDSSPVLPGESSTIFATYNAKNAGAFRKTVKVTTSRGETPIVLTLMGKVVPGME